MVRPPAPALSLKTDLARSPLSTLSSPLRPTFFLEGLGTANRLRGRAPVTDPGSRPKPLAPPRGTAQPAQGTPDRLQDPYEMPESAPAYVDAGGASQAAGTSRSVVAAQQSSGLDRLTTLSAAAVDTGAETLAILDPATLPLGTLASGRRTGLTLRERMTPTLAARP